MLLAHLASALVSYSSCIYPAAGHTGETGRSDSRENVCPVCVCVGVSGGTSKKNKPDMCSDRVPAWLSGTRVLPSLTLICCVTLGKYLPSLSLGYPF